MNIKKLLEKNYCVYGLAIFSWIFIFFTLPAGFKTIVDEAFFVLGLNPAQELGIQHTQFFQMARFVFRIFHLEPIIYVSRVVAFIFNILTLAIFACSSYYWLYKKQHISHRFELYISMVFLWGILIYFSSYEMSFTFNHLSIFFTACQVSCYLLWDVVHRKICQSLLLVALGGFSLLTILNYFPTGILLSGVLLALIIWKNTQWKHIITTLILFSAGLIIFAIGYNFCVYSLTDAVRDIITTIQNPAFGTGGYTTKDFLMSLWEYAGLTLMLGLSTLGILFLYDLNRRHKLYDQSTLSIVLFVLIFVFIFFERLVFKYDIFLLPVFMAYFFANKENRLPDIQTFFFFLFPVIAIQGTNVSLSWKLTYVAFLWILPLFQYLTKIKNRHQYLTVLYVSVFLAIGIGFGNYFYNQKDVRNNILNSRQTVENNYQFQHIKLKQSQIDYFQQIDSLLTELHFDRTQDRILTFDNDYAVMLYLNAPNYGGLMHHVTNMEPYSSVYDSLQNAPEYMIISKREGYLFKQMADKFHWNFPAHCNEYQIVNSTDEKDFGSGDRALLVKK